MISFWSAGKHTPSLKDSCFNDHLFLPDEPTTATSFLSPSSTPLSSKSTGELFRLFQLSYWYYPILAKTLSTGTMSGPRYFPSPQLGRMTGHTSAIPSIWWILWLHVRNWIYTAAWSLCRVWQMGVWVEDKWEAKSCLNKTLTHRCA